MLSIDQGQLEIGCKLALAEVYEGVPGLQQGR